MSLLLRRFLRCDILPVLLHAPCRSGPINPAACRVPVCTLFVSALTGAGDVSRLTADGSAVPKDADEDEQGTVAGDTLAASPRDIAFAARSLISLLMA